MARHRAEDRYRAQKPVRRIIITKGDDVRSFVIRPWLAGTTALLFSTLAVLYLGATAYLVFRDGLIDASTARTADLQQAYETRIANLRSEIDRIASRQLLDQVAYDQKIEKLLTRQAELTDSQKLIGDLLSTAKANGLDVKDSAALGVGAPITTGSVTPRPGRAAGSGEDVAAAYAPATGDDPSAPFAALLDPAPSPVVSASLAPMLRNGEALPLPADRELAAAEENRPDLVAMADDLTRLRELQIAAAGAIAAAAEAKVAKAASIMRSIGVNMKVASAGTGSASDVGGPFVPVAASAQEIVKSVTRAKSAMDEMKRIRSATNRLPLESPLAGATVTSTFGTRGDPFLGRLAMHTGIDYRSPVGRDIPASAPGKVVFAGTNGGYGKMVEIDHGKGLTTRYAHMSSIAVRVGQQIAKGQKVGEVGSTGRSTGPHLHYETRVNGEAVNPQLYISAGDRLDVLFGG